ncbi:Ig-like domain-containing protein, partial [Volucribacter psittacicida]|uniref:Ig-like domain-containing protein n=1 Tax=Volucribacter psittacicida TaxID=203482 RepID=UPI001A9D57B5
PAGSTVTVTIIDKEDKTQTVTTTVKEDGSYEVEVPEALPEGEYKVTVEVTDPAGNKGDNNGKGTIDTTKPTITVDAPESAVVEASSETITGSVTVNDSNGVKQITVNGQDVTNATVATPVTITTDKGTLKVTGYEASTGVISYEYTEGNKAHNNKDQAVTDSFTVVATDTANNSQSSSLVVNITDSTLTAVADKDEVTAGVKVVASGNVLSNDVQGADSPVVVSNAGTLTGNYGSLTLNADGSYSYTLDSANAAVEALKGKSDTLTESFSYT